MKGNAIVLILPASVMIGLFIFGYLSLSQEEVVSNEELQHSLTINNELIDERTLHIEWKWGDFPEDGIRGNDFIEILLPDDVVDELNDHDVGVHISLSQGDQMIYESNRSQISANGLIIAFPNEVQDEQILGPSGEFTATFDELNINDFREEIEIRYFHTWFDHQIELKPRVDIDQRLIDEGIQSYWIVAS
ncbi:hypothetical protein ACM26V_24560 [Salipaludibacillus sp. HK11]|uniref:hypothetical protein n=1 Tax=Salipaludibacillus sp. HK11 TaxID=3394320 RepID=UPI0039FB8FB4